MLGGKKVVVRLDEFERRRINHSATASISRVDIVKRHPVDAWQLLLDVPSVRVTPYAQGVYVMSARGKAPSLNDPSKPSLMNVVVDGTPVVPHGDNGDGGGKWCELIAIWTRDR